MQDDTQHISTSAVGGKSIAIIGGGPGGLTLARLLQQQGAEVVVYERDQSRSARVQGSALDLHEGSGLAALEAAGLMEAFWANHRPDLDRLRLTDASGTLLHDHSRRTSGAAQRPEIERGPLRDILLDSLQPGTVQWDCKLEVAEPQGEQVVLHFAGGKTALTDIAIGSDGANSRLRELVTPIRPEYVGVSLVESLIPSAQRTVPELWDLLGGSALIALGGERTIGMGTKPDGSVLLYAGLKTEGDDARQSLEAASGPEQRVTWFHDNFKGWSELWAPLFSEAVSMVWRPLLVCPADQHWEPKQNLTLIGDAAHVMPPYAGEGVNMAMLDALVLSKLLLSEETPSAAIAKYEAEMFARMREMTADTMANTEMFYAPDASDRVVALFRSFGGGEADPPASKS
ncbi:2-polyprenyl-6-methoxyphenol hydroxylase-like oxidoreductase [Terriglobus roseus DSM 18391]|uniref:Flavin-dependent monooxygenase n=1 Tax=Terriglobus roseus (strain DSM 18391 / NRRL B-41598 / KBS 63) TaxID=926566 RepID=I3ZC70_TERRK|nr:NAD(P)/FAD-dependent oxidoreductase [Terriglobus roseus]AFL86838.1 2-polyprenyl-6-methoxyphenol hydroxylase-like oxidoreductase [Terriglobus roseus DSM 18391]